MLGELNQYFTLFVSSPLSELLLDLVNMAEILHNDFFVGCFILKQSQLHVQMLRLLHQGLLLLDGLVKLRQICSLLLPELADDLVL